MSWHWRAMSSQWGFQNLLQGLVPSELTAYLSVFNLFLTQWITAILSKEWQRDNFDPHKPLNLGFTNIWDLCSNFVEVTLSLNQTLLKFLLYARQTCMTQFPCEGLSSFNLKRSYYSYAWSCSLCERRTSFYMWFTYMDSHLGFWLALLHSVSYFFVFCRSTSLSLCTVFDSISPNIDEVLLINPSANVLSLGTLTSIIRTDLPILVELIDLMNSVIISLHQMTYSNG